MDSTGEKLYQFGALRLSTEGGRWLVIEAELRNVDRWVMRIEDHDPLSYETRFPTFSILSTDLLMRLPIGPKIKASVAYVGLRRASW